MPVVLDVPYSNAGSHRGGEQGEMQVYLVLDGIRGAVGHAELSQAECG